MENTENVQVICTICRATTFNDGTKLCDRCWELKTCIERDPGRARRILGEPSCSRCFNKITLVIYNLARIEIPKHIKGEYKFKGFLEAIGDLHNMIVKNHVGEK